MRVRHGNWHKAAIAAFLLSVIATAPLAAVAVDVINTDAIAREIIVNADNGESKTLTLPPHKKVTDICDSCVVVLGNATAEVNASDVVKIADGKILVRSK